MNNYIFSLVMLLLISINFAGAQSVPCSQSQFKAGFIISIQDTGGSTVSVQGDTLGNGNCYTLSRAQQATLALDTAFYQDLPGDPCMTLETAVTSTGNPNPKATIVITTDTTIVFTMRRGALCGSVIDTSCTRTYVFSFCFTSLPVTWSYQYAEETKSGQTTVHWGTERESGVEWFQVKQSTDGQLWTDFGTTTLAGNPGGRYAQTDWATGRYFKVIQKDFDGKMSESNTFEVSRSQNITLKVSSTHAEGTILVQGSGILSLIDQQGRTVITQEVMAGPVVTNLSPGLYTALLTKNNARFSGLIQIE